MMELPVNLLIVDDDEISREILREAIDQEGVEIDLASDGIDALEILTRKPFDILITDLNMPRMDGLTLLREARQRFPLLLAIVITGYGSLESAIEALRHGAYDYVQKPFKMEEMAITTRNAVQTVQMVRERNRILEELDVVRRRLRMIEAEKCLDEESSSVERKEISLLVGPYLASQRVLPLSFLEKPTDGTAPVLEELERLRDLKLKGIINDSEFENLKKAILNRMR
jgi:DNA-binding NtrC family response regulator